MYLKRRNYQKYCIIFSLFLVSTVKLVFVKKVLFILSHGLNSNLPSESQKFSYLRERSVRRREFSRTYIRTLSLTSRTFLDQALSFNRCNRIPSSLQVDCSELGCSRKRHARTFAYGSTVENKGAS